MYRKWQGDLKVGEASPVVLIGRCQRLPQRPSLPHLPRFTAIPTKTGSTASICDGVQGTATRWNLPMSKMVDMSFDLGCKIEGDNVSVRLSR